MSYRMQVYVFLESATDKQSRPDTQRARFWMTEGCRRLCRRCFYASWSLTSPTCDVAPFHWSDYTADSEPVTHKAFPKRGDAARVPEKEPYFLKFSCWCYINKTFNEWLQQNLERMWHLNLTAGFQDKMFIVDIKHCWQTSGNHGLVLIHKITSMWQTTQFLYNLGTSIMWIWIELATAEFWNLKWFYRNCGNSAFYSICKFKFNSNSRTELEFKEHFKFSSKSCTNLSQALW